MKKIFSLLLLICAVFAFSSVSNVCYAKKKGLSKTEIQTLSDTLDTLTQKVYANSLFSPADNNKLLSIKIALDNAILAGAKPEFAPLYYKVGVLLKLREYNDDAIDAFQTVLENFADTPLAPRSVKELTKMGVKIQAPGAPVK